MQFFKYFFLLSGVIAFSGCGGGSSGSGGSGGTEEGQVSMSITDAAVDDAQAVWVVFESIEVKPADGEAIEFEFDPPRSIDLLTLQGNASEFLLENETLPAGSYNWVRLGVDSGDCEVMEPGDSPEDSYIVLGDGSIEPLYIPSGAQSGLKLVSGFTVTADGVSDFTIDFDLRKSVIKPAGQPCHFLKPALRMVDNASSGSISGTVDPLLINDPSCLEDIEEGDSGNAVYVLAGLDVNPDDIDGDDLDENAHEDEADDHHPEGEDGTAGGDEVGNESDAGHDSTESGESSSVEYDDRGKVVTTALVTMNDESGVYEYTAGFLPAGDYTVAFTCEADLDEPEEEDDVDFLQSANVTVVAGQETIHDFTVIQ